MHRSWSWIVVRMAAAAVAVFLVMYGLGQLLTHVLVHGWVGHTDDSIERGLLADRTSFWNGFTHGATQLAEPINAEIALVVLVIALAIVTRRLAPPLFLAVAVGIESGIYFLVSTWDQRPRPTIPRLGPADPLASYPSGHVAASICLYGGLAVLAWVLTDRRWLQWTLTVLAVVIPPVMGLCRMYRGFHHLSDVLAGALLGLMWLGASTWFLLLPAMRSQTSAAHIDAQQRRTRQALKPAPR
jgi:membrane-associated phospholipid phosphatase